MAPSEVFARRRARLQQSLSGPALVVSGFARPRNFRGNRYPFRAESHFLYLVGRSLEGAVLALSPGRAVLYAEPPDPVEALWSGPMPSLDALAKELGFEVRPIAELVVDGPVALLPPQDRETASWLEELVERPVDAGGAELAGADAALADAIIELRLRHDEAAIAELREATRVTGLAHQAGMRATRAGVRECVVRAAMEAEIIGSGMTTSYGSIVTVHGEVLHNERHDGWLTDGDLLLADVGAETPGGWAGDVTRTWPVSGRMSGSQRAVYEVVESAQSAAISAVRPGASFRDVHRTAARSLVRGLCELGVLVGDPDQLFARGAAALFFPHGVGHLLGLDVHDMEDLGDRAGYAPGRKRSTSPGERYLRLDRTLEPGMCVTIEPGFYRIPFILDEPRELGELAGAIDRRALEQLSDVRGIRIEDDVLVTPSGAEVLTAAIPKTVAEIESAMRA